MPPLLDIATETVYEPCESVSCNEVLYCFILNLSFTEGCPGRASGGLVCCTPWGISLYNFEKVMMVHIGVHYINCNLTLYTFQGNE